jgi:hypothetical protein
LGNCYLNHVMKKSFLFFILLGSFFCQAGKPLDPPNIIYVDINATGANDGTSWLNAYTDLQVAMDAAAVDAELWIAAGTYLPTQVPEISETEDNVIDGTTITNRDKGFHLMKNLKLYGGFVGTESDLSARNPVANQVILSGDFLGNDVINGTGSTLNITNNTENAYHVIITKGLTNEALFDGINITGGNANVDAKLIYYDINLDRKHGGGQYNSFSSPTLVNCNIYGNSTANYGAGQLNIGSGTVNISAILINCNMYNNSSEKEGGGQFNWYASPSLTYCKMYGNRATEEGGGQTNWYANPSLYTCTIYGNGAGKGGGQSNWLSGPFMMSCNFYNNSATSNGGGLYISGSYGTPDIKNSIFWANQKNGDATVAGADIEYYTNSTPPAIAYSMTQGYAAGSSNNVHANPQFTDPANGNFNLMGCSPAIDTGNRWSYFDTDKDAGGNSRIYNELVDKGAYERQSPKTVFDLTAPLATLPKTYQSIETVDAGNGWLNYCGCEGDNPVLLLSLNTGTSGAVILANGVYVKIGDPLATYYTTQSFITNPDGAALMNREWNVAAAIQPGTGETVGVRHYYTDTDYAAVNTALDGAEKSPMDNQSQMSFYKVTDNNLGMFPAVSSITSDKVLLIKNGANPTVSTWKLGTVTVGNYAEFLVSSFSGGGGGSGPSGGSLPVTMVSFTAKMQNQAAVLRWTTAAESHNQGFEIQRRVNNMNFEPIGFVNAQGEGTSARNQDYTFTDSQMQAGANYYRLKQLDMDGTFTFSRIVNLDRHSGDEARVYPMPVADVLHVEYNALENEDLQVTLLSPSGTVQYSKSFKVVKGANTLRLDFAPVKTGSYLIQLTSPKATVTRHLTKQ